MVPSVWVSRRSVPAPICRLGPGNTPATARCRTRPQAAPRRLSPAEMWREHLFAVARVCRIEVDARPDDLVNAIEQWRCKRDVGCGQLAVELLHRPWSNDR